MGKLKPGEMSECRNSLQGKSEGHGRFKANVPSEACTKLGVCSGKKGVEGRRYTKLNISPKSTEQGLNFPFCCSTFLNQDETT